MASEPDWALYRAFLAVLTEGSLSGAARRLGLTQPTIGRQVESLEQALDTALYTRAPQGMTPTEAARALEPHARAMASAAAAARRAVSGGPDAIAGTIRLTASEIIGAEVLPQVLADFLGHHPGVEIELVPTNRPEDLLRRDADIAIRMARPTQKALIARQVGRVDIGLFAHRRYLDAHGRPASVDELRRHTLVGYDRLPIPGDLRTVGGLPITRDLFTFRTDSDLAQLAAVRAGVGIGGIHHGIARRDPDLVPVLPDQVRFDLDMWLAIHEDQRSSPRLRALFDHLAAAMADYAKTSHYP
jgi:DNA-binding transcriptional LysR family regulator